MLPSHYTMKFRIAAFAAFACAPLLLAACGDGPDDQTPDPAATATTAAGDFGPPPVLGGNIVAISPGHAERVTQASTVTTNAVTPKGVCVKVTFDGLPQEGQSFRFIIDETDVTAAGETVWVISASQAATPKGGSLCFAPKGGLKIGRHTAAIGVQDPNNLTAPFKQIVAWAFEVTA